MIYSVDFKEIVNKINPYEFCKYLKDLGWVEFDRINKNYIKIFQKEIEHKFYQINIPMERSLSDFSQAMLRACKTLSETTNKSLEQIILELLNPLSDIVRIRIDNKNVKNGSLLFEDGLKLYDSAKKLITNTAMSLCSDNIYYKGKLPEDVQKFINNCRFGQTEIGSYVVSVVCPFMKESKTGPIQLSIFDDEDECSNSLTRKITNKLNNDLINIKNTIDNCKSLDSLLKGENKVNINFLETLKNLNLENEDGYLEITTKWAPTVNKNISNYKAITFNHDYYNVLNSKVVEYKENADIGAKEYVGQIKSLTSAPTIENRSFGIIKLVTIVNRRSKTINIKLNKEDYQKAIIAHSNGTYIKVKCTNESSNRLKCIEYEDI